MSKVSLSVFLSTRVSPTTADAFTRKTVKHGGRSEVMRELVEAFVEGRIVINAPPQKEIYHVNRK